MKHWSTNVLEKSINKVMPKIAKGIKPKQQKKMVETTLKINNFIITIFKAIFFMILFQKSLNLVGFEKTAIALLTIIMIILRNK